MMMRRNISARRRSRCPKRGAAAAAEEHLKAAAAFLRGDNDQDGDYYDDECGVMIRRGACGREETAAAAPGVSYYHGEEDYDDYYYSSHHLHGYVSPPYTPSTPGTRGGGGFRGARAAGGYYPAGAESRMKSDPVAKGNAMRQAWSRDAFLKNSSSRKFDLRQKTNPWGGQGGMTMMDTLPRRSPCASPQNLRPTYVPPHEKRRDAVRMNTRLWMNSGGPLV